MVEYDKKNIERAWAGFDSVLLEMGRDPETDPAVSETPARAVKALLEIGQPMTGTSAQEILSKRFASDSTAPVFLGPINFVSLCEHHLLPFTGNAYVAYQPDGENVVGLSKLARLVRYFAKRPQIQEGMTAQILDALMEHAPSQGAFVMISGNHTCMSMRGVNVQGADMVTVKGAGTMMVGTDLYKEMLSLAQSR